MKLKKQKRKGNYLDFSRVASQELIGPKKCKMNGGARSDVSKGNMKQTDCSVY